MIRKHTHAPGLFRWTLALVIPWIVIAAPCLHAQKSSPTENEVKSAYLYNFGKFVEWPAKASSIGEFFSRWGRFQDADESAHYEFLCKSAGIPVHYCAEPGCVSRDIAPTVP
jgi:hypothetical protein